MFASLCTDLQDGLTNNSKTRWMIAAKTAIHHTISKSPLKWLKPPWLEKHRILIWPIISTIHMPNNKFGKTIHMQHPNRPMFTQTLPRIRVQCSACSTDFMPITLISHTSSNKNLNSNFQWPRISENKKNLSYCHHKHCFLVFCIYEKSLTIQSCL